MATTDLLAGTFFLFTSAKLLGVCLGFIAFAGFTAVPILLSGFHNLPRILIPYIAAAMVFVISKYYSDQVNMLYTCFVGAIYPFAFFSRKEKWQIAVTFSVLILFVIITPTIDMTPAFNILGLRVVDDFPFSRNAADLIILGCSFLIVSSSFYIFSEVSERYATQLENAARRDKELNTKLNSLVQIICHDIANPLTVAKVVLSAEPESLTPQGLEKVQRSVRVMNGIVESVGTLLKGPKCRCENKDSESDD